MRLLGSVAFVTGAAQGLGKAFSESLLQRGARVCLSDVQVSKGREVEDEFKTKFGKDKVLFLKCDVTSEDSFSSAFRKAISEFGAIDLLVNNAGIGNESKGREMVDINLKGPIFGTSLAMEHMRKDKGGKGGTIINISSTAGLTPVYFSPIYVATKYGVVGFTRSWASNPHNGEMGIQYACLCPAFTDTAMMNYQEESVLYLHEAMPMIHATGINKVEDIVKAFLQLVESENCNGEVVTVTAKNGIQYRRQRRQGKSQL